MTWFGFLITLLVYALAGVLSTTMIVDICNDTYDMFTGKIELPKWAKIILYFTGIIWPIHIFIALSTLLAILISIAIESVQLHNMINDYNKQKKEKHDNA